MVSAGCGVCLVSAAMGMLSALLPVMLSEMAGGWTVAVRSPFNPRKMRLDGKTALVTGANTGIGRITALELARAGATVILHGRSRERMAAVADEIARDGGKARVVTADLGHLSSVPTMLHNIARFNDGPLDIAILNAGLCKDCVGSTTAGYELTSDGFELHIQVNHLAHQLLVELLIKQGSLTNASRLVSVSSDLHSRSYPEGIRYENWGEEGRGYTDGAAYGQSKLANIMMAHEVRKRFGIPSVSLHLGIIATDIGRYQDKEGYFVPVGRHAAVSHPAFTGAASAACWERSHEHLAPFLAGA
mmetsp:Transcript_34705/g.110065  ORF Transcript_34705/g.110065 Transcript_34705/m.110065 type:complete len:303 (+) Transcript_34705:59-967(+)